MDFRSIFQLREKKFWWMDVIFYFVIALLIATVLSYFIFLVKNSFQNEDIKKETAALQTVGTNQQKDYEKSVIGYRKKINDFTNLFKNHEFASNVFAFMQTQTMPNIWFKQFSLDEKNGAVQLSGEADSMDALSRQTAIFEKNKYVQNLGNLSSSVGDSGKIQFNMNLTLDQKIFTYISDLASILEPPIPVQQQPSAQQGPATPASPITGNEKLITSFHLLLTPEIIGLVDQTNYAVTLVVPFGTNVKNLTTAIVVSPGATISPQSNVSQDFTNPVTYTVSAQDDSKQDYKVAVSFLPQITKKSNRPDIAIILTAVVSIFLIIVVIVAAFFLYKKRMNNKTQI